MKRKQIAYLVGIILLLVIGYWYLNSHKASAPDATAPIEGRENQISANSNSNNSNSSSKPKDIVVMSEQTAGSSVTVDNFYLTKPGFIAIEQLGATFGHSGLLQAGAGQDLEISAKVKSGEDYVATIYVDDGDKKFDPLKDKPIDINGQLVGAKFMVK